MEIINGTHKKSPSNSSKGNKRSCPKQKVARKHATTHMVDKCICTRGQVEKDKLPPSTCKLDQQSELILQIMMLFDLIS
jgi:hypothetical protein